MKRSGLVSFPLLCMHVLLNVSCKLTTLVNTSVASIVQIEPRPRHQPPTLCLAFTDGPQKATRVFLGLRQR
jgi:hypothetical protein